MTNIYLAGGGLEEPSRHFDRFFINNLDLTKKLLYVPVAACGNYENCFSWFKDFYGRLGVKNIELFTRLDQPLPSDISEYTGMYIAGGNTFFLLDEVRKAGFGKIIAEFLSRGLGVFGTSAGAILLGNDIVPCMHLDPNDIGMTDFTGLNLVGGRSVWCHYNPQNDELIRAYLKKHNCEAVAIPDNCGVYFDGKTLKPMGPDPVFLFRGDEKTKLN